MRGSNRLLALYQGSLGRVRRRVARMRADRQIRRQVARMEAYLAAREAESPPQGPPVLFFNASTRIHRVSLNAAYSLLASWALRLAGVPVRYVVCREGMRQCMLGTNREDLTAPPPCATCQRLSDWLFPRRLSIPLTLDPVVDQAWAALEGRSLEELTAWEQDGLPLGRLCLPGLRWVLRRHHLDDDEATRTLFRQYLASAAGLARRFQAILEEERPRALVVFNGITFPEAVAREVARRRGVPVVTHEVGLRPFSAFFSHQDATFREVELPPDFDLGPEENARLDRYLEERFRGRFTMAGVQFWPEMEPLPDWLQQRMAAHRQTVAVFTNVIFDTSQVHANVLFEDMFDWLDELARVISAHPETLFVLRAHPDEERPGKESRESVADWVRSRGLEDRSNVVFFAPRQYVSSYELIRQAKFTLVYNSSIGLEASILGAPVLCAGRARYTQVPTVFFPASREEYLRTLEGFLDSERIEVPEAFRRNARRFLYFELFHASLDFSPFLHPDPTLPGFVVFRNVLPGMLAPDSSQLGSVLLNGVLDGRPFVYRSPSSAHAGVEGRGQSRP